ncbi:bifunctional DNA primase/polymerase [Streptomyces rubiginosohelvolus]|uniref:bifunctional DNA primase/polymerase n=1 Tax=Streptomyces rubiginosohelvolus TaxID=67362 RepID=UPI0036F7AB8B
MTSTTTLPVFGKDTEPRPPLLNIPKDLPSAALAYGASGIRVFRVRPDKSPFANCPRCRPPTEQRPNPMYIPHRPDECRCWARTCHGFHAATTDPELIHRWWTEEPNANIGAPCALNGWAVLDIDPRHGGHLSLAVLEQRVGVLPGTVMQLTGGGGLHILYRTPSVQLPGTLGPGLDVKHNGYILLAPSVHSSGRKYQWSGHSKFLQPEAAWPAVLTPQARRAA